MVIALPCRLVPVSYLFPFHDAPPAAPAVVAVVWLVWVMKMVTEAKVAIQK